jgi:hypothetical protein
MPHAVLGTSGLTRMSWRLPSVTLWFSPLALFAWPQGSRWDRTPCLVATFWRLAPRMPHGVETKKMKEMNVKGIFFRGLRYHWRVRSALPGCVSAWSEPARFVTALWQGWAPGIVPLWASSGAFVYLRLEIPQLPDWASATAFVSAFQDGPNERLLGAYRLYVNGKFAAIGPVRGEKME